jgi:hypothetical protein
VVLGVTKPSQKRRPKRRRQKQHQLHKKLSTFGTFVAIWPKRNRAALVDDDDCDADNRSRRRKRKDKRTNCSGLRCESADDTGKQSGGSSVRCDSGLGRTAVPSRSEAAGCRGRSQDERQVVAHLCNGVRLSEWARGRGRWSGMAR